MSSIQLYPGSVRRVVIVIEPVEGSSGVDAADEHECQRADREADHAEVVADGATQHEADDHVEDEAHRQRPQHVEGPRQHEEEDAVEEPEDEEHVADRRQNTLLVIGLKKTSMNGNAPVAWRVSRPQKVTAILPSATMARSARWE